MAAKTADESKSDSYEPHFTASETIRDIIIGMADGLTVPFALAAGLSGAVTSTAIIVIAGLAEIAAGSISMGLGGYLAAKSDAEHYLTERGREEWEIVHLPDKETKEVEDILESYGLTREEAAPVVAALKKRHESWLSFMMRFELGLEEPDPRRAVTSAGTIAGSYAVGGFIPLAPYFFIANVHDALLVSIVLTAAALAIFGYVKGRFTSATPIRSAMQTTLIGAVAAAVAFGVARLIS